jgi:epsilon-lactone hydrolase
VTAGGVPAHWLAAPGADTGRMLLFLHGGGYELGSLRSDGELAARLGRASGLRVLFPEYRLALEHPSPPPSTTSWPRGAGSAPAWT